jgi:hypothetical protein
MDCSGGSDFLLVGSSFGNRVDEFSRAIDGGDRVRASAFAADSIDRLLSILKLFVGPRVLI